MTIIDNRVLLTDAEALDPAGNGLWENQAASDMGPTLNTDNFIAGAASVSDRLSNSTIGLLWNTEVTNDWTDNVFYFWLNMTQVPGLDTVDATGDGPGMSIRFTGPTVTNWFEVFVAGSDTQDKYSGGWKMFVIDIEQARINAVSGLRGQTNGTPPETSAIQRLGVVTIAPGNIVGTVDNVHIDSIWRLPPDTAAIVVLGTNGGDPYTIEDILDAGDNTDPTKAWGTLERLKNGTLSLNAPIQIGPPIGSGSPDAGGSPTVTTFLDTNEVVGWEEQLVRDGFYKISTSSGSPTTVNFTLGVKTGTGDDATGAQGFVITAADRQLTFGSPTFERIRWDLDFTNQNTDLAALYGCSLIGGNVFQLDSSAVEAISTLYIDSNEALVMGSTQVRNQVINANTFRGPLPIGSPAPGSPLVGSPLLDVSFMKLHTMDDIVFCTFGFSQSHALELTLISGSPTFTGSPVVPNAQTSKGNRFSGYGADETLDAAIHNSSGKNLTVAVTEGGSLGEHTQHNPVELGSPVFITFAASVTITVTVNDTAGDPIENAQTAIYRVSDDLEIMNQDTDALGVATTGFSQSTPVNVSVRVRKNSPGATRYFPVNTPQTITPDGLILTVTLLEDTVAG